jgi:hypothetical protein
VDNVRHVNEIVDKTHWIETIVLIILEIDHHLDVHNDNHRYQLSTNKFPIEPHFERL